MIWEVLFFIIRTKILCKEWDDKYYKEMVRIFTRADTLERLRESKSVGSRREKEVKKEVKRT